VELEFQGKF